VRWGGHARLRRQRGERSSNPSKAPSGQDSGSVERCTAGEERGGRTASLDRGGELVSCHRIREVRSIRTTREGGALSERGRELELHHWIGDVDSIHIVVEGR
jgi:hypothetical protein